MSLEVNDKVNDDFLGEGVVVKIIKGDNRYSFAYLVWFINTPPKDYNNGKNPCLRFKGSLKKISL